MEPAEIRSELMLLNVPEASGWVAYHCTPSEEPEMEDYRVVVIRQQTGTIIYDSQIPLAVDLCTHGFEMAPDDPRLQHLARTVDSSIIEPLEAFRRNQPAPDPIAAPAEPPLASSDSTSEPATETETETADLSEAEATVPETTEPAVTTRDEEEDEKPFILGAYENEVLHIDLKEAGSLSQGDRLFVRNPPQIIALPGTDEQILVSEGEVVGLVEVISTEGLTASAKLLNGEIPENGHLEKTE
ncbi:MAG: hypothetical protein PF795_07985 [Kiritimatiellae bacterium]|nr:hypothetical protein [Kiritimatiellia bacterium]